MTVVFDWIQFSKFHTHNGDDTLPREGRRSFWWFRSKLAQCHCNRTSVLRHVNDSLYLAWHTLVFLIKCLVHFTNRFTNQQQVYQPVYSVDKKNQLDVTFCILYFSSNICSTYFGQPCAHHQELTNA